MSPAGSAERSSMGLRSGGLSSCGVARPIISDFHSDDPGSNPGPSTLKRWLKPIFGRPATSSRRTKDCSVGQELEHDFTALGDFQGRTEAFVRGVSDGRVQANAHRFVDEQVHHVVQWRGFWSLFEDRF